MAGKSPEDPEVVSEFLSVGEAAVMLGVSVDTMRRWDRDGRITALRTPTKHRRFRRSDVETLLKAAS
jgi:excisionase family DNA binding protein